MTPKAVAICGGSCSGKTTLALDVHEALGADQSAILPQDDYFFGLGDAPVGKGGANFDHPNAVDFDQMVEQLTMLKSGRNIERPLYDFHTHMPRIETFAMEPRPVILVDGILILHEARLRPLFDLTIFVHCDSETRLARRLERDVKERGRTADSVHAAFVNQVAPMHDQYVEPSQQHADIVVNSSQLESPVSAARQEIISKIISLIQ